MNNTVRNSISNEINKIVPIVEKSRYIKRILHFTAKEDNSSVCLKANGKPNSIKLDYSYDGQMWITYTINSIITLNNNETVYFRGDNSAFSKSTINYYQFQMEGIIEADGEITSLLDTSLEKTDVPDYCFIYLFENNVSLISAPKFPALTVGSYGYYGTFMGCTSLINPPEISAIVLNSYACYDMFYNCTSLVSAPELYFTTVSTKSCSSMFFNCRSMISAPTKLLASNGETSCYADMFSNCFSISKSPEIYLTSHAKNCMYMMFHSCGSLTEITVHFTEWSDDAMQSTYCWVEGINTKQGIFRCPSALQERRGNWNIPKDWTIERF